MGRIDSKELIMPPLATGAASAHEAGLLAQVRRSWYLYVMLLPAFLSAIVFYYYPLASGLFHSFTYWDLKQTIWIGLENYQRMFDDAATVTAWRNMFTILIAQLVIVITAPLLGAALVAHLKEGRALFAWRITFILPIVVPATRSCRSTIAALSIRRR